jgi:hypothetical protein
MPEELLEDLAFVTTPAIFQNAPSESIPRLLAPVVFRKRRLEQFFREDIGAGSSLAI